MENDSGSFENNNTLDSFNEEHRYGRLLGWKIRKGLENGVSVIRIKKYTDWIFKNYIEPLLDNEEQYIFPILGENHKYVKKALTNHRRLRRLFKEKNNVERALYQIEEELDQHIRFEERELFVLIQEKATPEQLKRIEESYESIDFVENTDDIFWE